MNEQQGYETETIWGAGRCNVFEKWLQWALFFVWALEIFISYIISYILVKFARRGSENDTPVVLLLYGFLFFGVTSVIDEISSRLQVLRLTTTILVSLTHCVIRTVMILPLLRIY